MIRAIVLPLVFAALLFSAGCGGSGQPAASHDDWFRQQNEQFERHRADHVKRSSDAVRGYLRYRNK
jgi:hypothetical protein